MAKSLPHAVSQRLALTLGQWRQWQTGIPLQCAPTIDSHLDEGVSNTSVLVASNDHKFVVRLDGIDTRRHSLNRHVEWRTLCEASAAGLAPRPVYRNPELGVLVCEYLCSDENQQQTETDVANLLKRIHCLPAVHQRVDLSQRIRQYLHQLEARQPGLSQKLLTLSTVVERIIQLADHDHSQLVLCHNDLHKANRLRSQGNLYALDWEYSGMGHRWFDLAVVCECDTETIAPDKLLNAYLGRPANLQDSELLLRFRLCYRFVDWLWYAVCSQRPITDSEVATIESTLSPALTAVLHGSPS